MRTSLVLILVSATAIVICAQYATTKTEAAENAAGQEEVRRVQDDLINAYVHRDINALDRALGDEYKFVADDGSVMDKAKTIASFKSGERQITSYVRDEERVRVYGDTAIMTYRYASKETYKGQDDSSNDRLIRVFVKRNGRWQIVAGQETRISENNGGRISEQRGHSQASVRERLLGAWRLVSDFEIRPDGSRRPEYGPDPIGYLMYEKTGHMCATLANANAPRWADPTNPTDQERVLTHKSMEAYCGTFEVRESTHQVIHRLS